MKTNVLILEGSANVGKTSVLTDVIKDLRNNGFKDIPNLTISDYINYKNWSWIPGIQKSDTFVALEKNNKYVIITTAGDSQQCIMYADGYVSWVINSLNSINLNVDSKVIWVTALSRDDKNYSNNGIGCIKWTVAGKVYFVAQKNLNPPQINRMELLGNTSGRPRYNSVNQSNAQKSITTKIISF